MSKIITLVALLIVLAAGGYLLWGASVSPHATAGQGADDAGSVDAGDNRGALEMAKPPRAAAPDRSRSGDPVREAQVGRASGPGPNSLRMPDGTYLPVLNGAVGAPAAEWPKGRPYSPVVKKVIDAAGLEWYLHADGSYTITQNQYRSDLGKTEPATLIYNPTESKPMEPGELERATRDRTTKGAGKDGVPRE